MSDLLDDLEIVNQGPRLSEVPTLHRWLIALAAYAWVATGIAAYDVETVIATGPIGGIMGILMYAFVKKYSIGRNSALSAVLFVLFCCGLIVGLNWSPSDAQMPIPILMGSYAIGLTSCIGYLRGRDVPLRT